MLRLEIQIPSILVLIGTSGAGKTSLAQRLFLRTEILSSDSCRALVSDQENDQSATPEAFELLLTLARLRLKRKRLCVIDATNLTVKDRAKYLALGNEFQCPVCALVVNPGIEICLERTSRRGDRDISVEIVKWQHDELLMNRPSLSSEGYSNVWELTNGEVGASSVKVLRRPDR
jgi:protein phosphatase